MGFRSFPTVFIEPQRASIDSALFSDDDLSDDRNVRFSLMLISGIIS